MGLTICKEGTHDTISDTSGYSPGQFEYDDFSLQVGTAQESDLKRNPTCLQQSDVVSYAGRPKKRVPPAEQSTNSDPHGPPKRSVVTCTKDETTCTILWEQRQMSVRSGSETLIFEFDNIGIRGVWTQASYTEKDTQVRRCVLGMEKGQEPFIILAPDEPVAEESVIPRLAKELEYQLEENPTEHTEGTSAAPAASYDSHAFGEVTMWPEEPIFPIAVLVMRHGQELRHPSPDPPLGDMGKSQCAMASCFINEVTGGFKYTNAIWSSNLRRSADSASIVKKFVSQVGISRSPTPIIPNNLLAEFIPPYPYIIDDSVDRSVADQVERDGYLMEEGRWLVSAALRGAGILVPEKKDKSKMPDSPRMLGTRPQDLFETCRLPVLHNAMKSKGTPPSDCKRSPMNFVYCGHSNTIRYQVFEELGFPKHFWRFVAVPHGAVLPMGILHSGKPAMIVADAGYLSSNSPILPITFTPHIRGPSHPAHNLSFRDRLLTDARVCLVQEQEWNGRYAATGISYNAPPEVDGVEKTILLVRAGHNRLDGCEDMGLTSLGVKQIEAAGRWLGRLIMSNRVAKIPQRWCAGGLTSQYSTVDMSLKQSILLLRKRIETYVGKETMDEELTRKENLLHPDNLFAAPTEPDSTLYVVVADDYHLLKYFGACFGIDPSVLRNLYWPHAGYVAVTVTEPVRGLFCFLLLVYFVSGLARAASFWFSFFYGSRDDHSVSWEPDAKL
eukprot:GHVN01036737.1.p1 GENE.GHVN01036737.1~~GHVN01036737.1.p1  ORF type:complete len:726 (+),score=59.38 GHVN01036737.1:94-2271(+)